MSLPASPRIESAITEIAARNGIDVAQLVDSVLGRFIEDDAEDLEAMRAAVAESRAAIAAGDYTVYTAETLPQLVDEIEREARDPERFPG